MGPVSDYPSPVSNQASACGRQRLCLLKGCGRSFQPPKGLSRYCSEACVEAARRWSKWKANGRYRASDQGRCRRRDQCRRWRMRAAQRRPAAPSEQGPSEGYQEGAATEKSCCSRPGCYERFTVTARSPLQRFCSFLCRRALCRVLQREARWRRRHLSLLRSARRPWKPPDS